MKLQRRDKKKQQVEKVNK